jgi:hypothetical protein
MWTASGNGESLPYLSEKRLVDKKKPRITGFAFRDRIPHDTAVEKLATKMNIQSDR